MDLSEKANTKPLDISIQSIHDLPDYAHDNEDDDDDQMAGGNPFNEDAVPSFEVCREEYAALQ